MSSLPAVEKQEPKLKQGRTSIAGIGLEIATPNSKRAPRVAGADCLGVAGRVKGEDGLTTASIAAAAARAAINDAGLTAQSIEQIIVGTTSPDVLWPATACLVQTELRMGMVPAFDLYAGDASGLTALSVAERLIRGGSGRTLVIAADSDNQLVDLPGQSAQAMTTRMTGAAALVLGPGDEGRCELLATTTGGSARSKADVQPREALDELVKSTRACLERAGTSQDQIGSVIYDPEQRPLVEKWATAIGLPSDRLDSESIQEAKGGSVSILARFARLITTPTSPAPRESRTKAILLISTTAGPAWALACVQLHEDSNKSW